MIITKAHAVARARQLKSRLKGREWKIRVWENVGWHYAVETKRLSVGEYEGRYHCCLIPGYPLFGERFWSKDPNLAVKSTILRAKSALAEYDMILTEAVESIQ